MRSGVGLCGRRSRGGRVGGRGLLLVEGGWGLGLGGFREEKPGEWRVRIALGRW
jgi:hypothetical protein